MCIIPNDFCVAAAFDLRSRADTTDAEALLREVVLARRMLKHPFANEVLHHDQRSRAQAIDAAALGGRQCDIFVNGLWLNFPQHLANLTYGRLQPSMPAGMMEFQKMPQCNLALAPPGANKNTARCK